MPKRQPIFGQDPLVLQALWANVVSWFVRSFFPSFVPKLLQSLPEEDRGGESSSTSGTAPAAADAATQCVVIGRPGGVEQLRTIRLREGLATAGYNVAAPLSWTVSTSNLPPNTVVLANHAFAVNFADCCIRWGLYDSAQEYVGWPICPGFDVAGRVEASNSEQWQVGDHVFGCTLFGGYSNRVVVPAGQLLRIPSSYSFQEAASIPTVALTSLYALQLAGMYPARTTERPVLIHSAAGGVGGMLVQMAKLLGMKPVVGVVGSSTKVEAAKSLGCDVVIDRSNEDLWVQARIAAPSGYGAVFDATGVSTLEQSYEHLALGGRLIVYGFHTNLPVGKDCLSPWEWVQMSFRQNRMPKFDPMDMVNQNKAVLGFNLSFFANESEMLMELFAQILQWFDDGSLVCPRVTDFPMSEIQHAHNLIQSGKSIGKIVLTTGRK